MQALGTLPGRKQWAGEGPSSRWGRYLPLLLRGSSVSHWAPLSLTFQNESVSSSISDVYSQGQRGGSGSNMEGPRTHEFGPKCTRHALFFAAVHVYSILLSRTPLPRLCPSHSCSKTFIHSVIHSFTHLLNKHRVRHERCLASRVPAFRESMCPAGSQAKPQRFN